MMGCAKRPVHKNCPSCSPLSSFLIGTRRINCSLFGDQSQVLGGEWLNIKRVRQIVGNSDSNWNCKDLSVEMESCEIVQSSRVDIFDPPQGLNSPLRL